MISKVGVRAKYDQSQIGQVQLQLAGHFSPGITTNSELTISQFNAGCQSVDGNTNDSCELTIEGHEVYCPGNPDDPACTDFLHDTSNKQPHSTIGACGQEPYHPGCPQIVNPERYCLTTDDPAFCKTIGDICDADGFVKPEDAYCTNRS